MIRLIASASLLALTAGSALAAVPVQTGESAIGAILTDENGMTLYTFDKDTAGTSNCYDKCAANWPPLAAGANDAAEGDFSIVTRKDGSLQWAYKEMPLYLWVKDGAPGDVSGDGVNGIWHVVKQ